MKNKKIVYLTFLFLIIILLSISCAPKTATKTNLNYKKYLDLPEDLYSHRQAFKKFDVISIDGKITNLERMEQFFQNFKRKKKDTVRVINFGPGRPVIHLLINDGKKITYFLDATRNHEIGSPTIVKMTGKKMLKQEYPIYSKTGNDYLGTAYYIEVQIGKTKKRRLIATSKLYKNIIKNKIVLESVKTTESKIIDLNGDQKIDKIFLNEANNEESALIQVNDASYNTFSRGELAIVDIDSKDRFKEIAFWNGDEEEAETDFYYYDGIKIISMGGIAGSIESIKIDGSGIVKTYTGSGFLQTWEYLDTYKLSEEHLLENVPQEIYEMNFELTVASDIPLQKSRIDPKIVTVLRKGEKAKLLKTDNRIWCLAQNKNGIKGWFAINSNGTIAGTQKRPEEFFSNLNFAD